MHSPQDDSLLRAHDAEKELGSRGQSRGLIKQRVTTALALVAALLPGLVLGAVPGGKAFRSSPKEPNHLARSASGTMSSNAMYRPGPVVEATAQATRIVEPPVEPTATPDPTATPGTYTYERLQSDLLIRQEYDTSWTGRGAWSNNGSNQKVQFPQVEGAVPTPRYRVRLLRASWGEWRDQTGHPASSVDSRYIFAPVRADTAVLKGASNIQGWIVRYYSVAGSDRQNITGAMTSSAGWTVPNGYLPRDELDPDTKRPANEISIELTPDGTAEPGLSPACDVLVQSLTNNAYPNDPLQVSDAVLASVTAAPPRVYETLRSDLLIRNKGEVAWVGTGIYTTDGAGEEAQQGASTIKAAVYDARFLIESYGYWKLQTFVPSTTASTALKGAASAAGWTARYLDQNGADITQAVTSSAGWAVPSGNLVRSDRGDRPGIDIRIELQPGATVAPRTAPPWKVLLQAIRFNSQSSDSTVVDAVLATATAQLTPSMDAMIRIGREEDYLGAGIHNTSAEGQTKSQGTSVGIPAIYTVKVQNDGGADSFGVTAPASGSGWSARYFDALNNGNDITSQVSGSGWSTGTLQTDQQKELRVEVSLDQSMAVGTPAELSVTVSSPAYSSSIDVVKASTGVQKIAGLEYSFDRVTWTPIVHNAAPPGPMAAGRAVDGDTPTTTGGSTTGGSTSTPDFSVMEGQSFGLRAAKGDPNLSWPSNMDTRPFPYLKPAWDQEGRKNVGDEIWAMYPSASANGGGLRTISVECGNTIPVLIRVLPAYTITLKSAVQMIVWDGSTADWTNTKLTATVKKWDGTPAPDQRVLFSALDNSGRVVGTINTSDSADDIVTTDASGKAVAELTSSLYRGDVHVVATLVAADNQGLQKAKEVLVNFDIKPAPPLPPAPPPPNP